MAAGARQIPPLLTLQNGVGNEEALAEAFGADRIISGAIDTPVSVPAAGQVQVHRERFKAGVAPVGQGAPAAQAAGLLRDAGFTMDLFTDYRSLKWSKLLMNLLANAQCAILDWTPAQVMADPVASRLEALAWQEAFAVMAAKGIRPVAMAGYPLPLLAPIIRRLPAAGSRAGCVDSYPAVAAARCLRCTSPWPRASGPKSAGSTARSRTTGKRPACRRRSTVP